jgi:hypothetical protein
MPLNKEHRDLLIFADEIANRLNTQIIRLLGEDATWGNHVGSTEIPKELDLNNLDTELLTELWILREGANGICASNNY